MSDRVGLIVLRAWIEQGSAEPLRVHVRFTNDISAGIQRTVTLSRPEQVEAAVREWLTEMLHYAEQ